MHVPDQDARAAHQKIRIVSAVAALADAGTAVDGVDAQAVGCGLSATQRRDPYEDLRVHVGVAAVRSPVHIARTAGRYVPAEDPDLRRPLGTVRYVTLIVAIVVPVAAPSVDGTAYLRTVDGDGPGRRVGGQLVQASVSSCEHAAAYVCLAQIDGDGVPHTIFGACATVLSAAEHIPLDLCPVAYVHGHRSGCRGIVTVFFDLTHIGAATVSIPGYLLDPIFCDREDGCGAVMPIQILFVHALPGTVDAP